MTKRFRSAGFLFAEAAHVYGQIIRAGGISAALLDRFAPHRAARSGAAGR